MTIRIGIECESIEGDSWGVGKMVYKLLEEIARRSELAREFRFYLYFKKRIPDFQFLDNPIFIKKVTKPAWFPASFNLHYHVWMILQAYRDGINTLFFPNYMLPIFWFRKSIVMLTDDIYDEMRNPQLPFRYRLAYGIFSNWAARQATEVMALSESSKNELIRLFDINPQRIFVNYLGVDAEINDVDIHSNVKKMRLTDPTDPTESYYNLTDRLEHNTSDNFKNFILFVGQMFPRRHAREVMLAFEKLQMPELQLVIVGTDKYSPPVIRHLANAISGRLRHCSSASLTTSAIIWKEYVPQNELAELYRKAQAVIYPSDREAFGLPPLEGLSKGSIPIVADMPVSREIFGEKAFYVKLPITDESLAQAMQDALTQESKRKEILAARNDILKKFTWRAFADRFTAEIKSLYY